MRGDQPVVSAASWMVRASVNAPNLTTIVSRFGAGLSARGPDHRLASLVGALVQGDDGLGGGIGAAQARDDRRRRLMVVLGPRRVDGDVAPHVADVVGGPEGLHDLGLAVDVALGGGAAD